MNETQVITLRDSRQATITPESIAHTDVATLVTDHYQEMSQVAGAESSHALGLETFKDPTITLYALRINGHLLGCGALRELDMIHGEIKTMRSIPDSRGLGVGRAVLDHLIAVARSRGYHNLSLETHPEEMFIPARALYTSRGFVPCGPFGDYVAGPRSYFMTLDLR